ncbi:MAG: PolC-type DNA polymerase III [Mycoplasmoidaceae bacterium]
MENKIRLFFEKTKLLDNIEIEQILGCCSFSVNLNNEIIQIHLIFEKLLLPEILIPLIKKIQNQNEINFVFNFKNCIYNFEDVSSYLIYFSKDNKLLNNKTKNVLERKSGRIENNILYMKYLNISEEYDLKNHLEMIKNFLSSFGIIFADIKFEFDEKKRDIELYRESKQKILISEKNPGNSENLIKRVRISGKESKIINLNINDKEAVIVGEIFQIEIMNTKNNQKIYKLYVSDETSSIIIKFLPWLCKNFINFVSTLKIGDLIKTRIALEIDKYEKNDITGNIIEILKLEKHNTLENIDTSAEKRIELLAHTNMSSFEGLNNFTEFGKRAILNGHHAIGLTDKLNCQSFPEAFNFSKKHQDQIKIIYGFQTNLVESRLKAVINPVDIELKNASYVVFDIETTGLYPFLDEIIEFGAIKYENEKIVDEIQFFINPKVNIPQKISQLTGIRDDMVKTGLEIKKALKMIKDFFGKSILIAHNGISFDINFINSKLEKYSLGKVDNPLIDTMVLSRSLNKFKSHSLGSLCRKYKIEYNDITAHRADFDAKVLLDVWKILIDQLLENKIDNLLNINNNIVNESLINKTRPYLANFHCLNQLGIKEMYQIISKSLTDNLHDYPYLLEKDFLNSTKNLLFSNSPTSGDIFESALYDIDLDLENKIKKYDFIFICPPSNFNHDILRENFDEKKIEKILKRIYDASIKLGKKVLASNEPFYIDKKDQIVYDIFIHTKAIGGKPHRLYSYNESNAIMTDFYFKTTDEMLSDFKFLGKEIAYEIVIKNPKLIVDMIDNNIQPIQTKLQTPIISNAEENLKELAYKNLRLIYGDNPHEFLQKRLEWELSSIIDNGYGVIYWFSHLLVKISNDDDYLVGSRGSIGSSFVATLINITDVNPLPPYYLCHNCKNFLFVKNVNSGFDLEKIKCGKCGEKMEGDGHNIPFEVFMGFNGDKVPDIDLNFSAEYQSKAHNYIKKTFGKTHVFRAGTISTVAEKTAYGYVKNYCELTNKHNVTNAEIKRLAKKCCNVKRTTGQHPGGIIVVPLEKDVYDFTPFNYPADDKTQDWYTTHYAFESLHDALLKFDILGHDSPTVLKMLKKSTGYDPKLIPNNDEKVMMMFNDISSLGIKKENLFNSSVASFGIPEFGTKFVREMLEITKPKNFSDLVRISGLSHGTDVWNNNAKELISKKNIDISEVISCRDDIMVYLQEKMIDPLISFKIMEDVRKGMGLKKEYIDIMKSANVPEWYIESCQKIKYLFPKAHATAYVDMAWKIAWYKKYYPLDFYASYLSIRISNFDVEIITKGKEYIREKYNEINSLLKNSKTKYQVKQKEIDLMVIYEILLEMMERGFKFKMVDLKYSLEKEFIVKSDYLIPPFSIIPGLGETAASSIITARKEKYFSDKEDFLSRTKINKTVLKTLDNYGVLNNLS